MRKLSSMHRVQEFVRLHRMGLLLWLNLSISNFRQSIYVMTPPHVDSHRHSKRDGHGGPHDIASTADHSAIRGLVTCMSDLRLGLPLTKSVRGAT